MSDDEPLNLLQISNSPGPGSAEPDPQKRAGGMVVLITLGYIVLGSILLITLMDRPGGIQIFTMVAYTFLVPYIASNRFLKLVPWNRLIRGRVLLVHCITLAIVYSITTEALAVEHSLPTWFIFSGRRPSLLVSCLGGLFLVLAFYEHYWAMKSKDE